LLPPVTVHWLLTQHEPAPQTFPQAPQLLESLSSQTQELPQTVASHAPQTPFLHEVAPGQT